MSEFLTLSATDARPRLAIRVGITGHRTFDEATATRLEAEVLRILSALQTELGNLMGEPDCAAIYRPGPVVHFLSPLAAGADRIGARAAKDAGAALSAVLPMPAAEYVKDFPDTVSEFKTLLEIARSQGGVRELYLAAGHSCRERVASYVQVGKFLLRHSDILIAIWDGKPARGKGGTANVIRDACRMGIPVIHIHSGGTEGTVVLFGDKEPSAFDPAAMDIIVRKIVLPDKQRKPPGGGAERHFANPIRESHRYLCSRRVTDSGMSADYLSQGPFAAKRRWGTGRVARIFPGLMNWFKPKQEPPPEPKPPFPAEEPVTRYLFHHFQRADVLATHYADLHRSMFVSAYVLAGMALIAAYFAILIVAYVDVPAHTEWAIIPEFVEIACLIAILIVWGLDHGSALRDKWLNFRLLAEVLRQSDVLALAGRPMPFRIMQELAADMPGRGWVSDVYCAIVRDAGMASAVVTPGSLATLRDYVIKTRLADQIAYHARTSQTSHRASKVMRTTGQWLFFLTILVVAGKIAMWKFEVHCEAAAFLFSMFAGVFPSLAYVLFAIRNQAEFEIVGQRSWRMAARLARIRDTLKAIAPDDLDSDALGKEILAATRVMRHDAADWASIFDVKETEAG